MKQQSGTSFINGGGAKGAEDKVIQHNGGGTVKVDSFCVRIFFLCYTTCSIRRRLWTSENSTAVVETARPSSTG